MKTSKKIEWVINMLESMLQDEPPGEIRILALMEEIDAEYSLLEKEKHKLEKELSDVKWELYRQGEGDIDAALMGLRMGELTDDAFESQFHNGRDLVKQSGRDVEEVTQEWLKSNDLTMDEDGNIFDEDGDCRYPWDYKEADDEADPI